jgi:hypothetical protein
VTDAHPIPEVTAPLGRYWDQPARADVLVDETHAVVTRTTFAKLCDYDRSNPSGAYVGKMWRRGGAGTLCWFAPDPEPGWVRVETRTLLVVD